MSFYHCFACFLKCHFMSEGLFDFPLRFYLYFIFTAHKISDGGLIRSCFDHFSDMFYRIDNYVWSFVFIATKLKLQSSIIVLMTLSAQLFKTITSWWNASPEMEKLSSNNNMINKYFQYKEYYFLSILFQINLFLLNLLNNFDP